ncbi:MAG: SDR family NAD(P)-dependent oxidoreductase, partial [Candidatus Thiodiazotropha taylori]|nr:SDR family NAD(P)-dependent oxidoreductase [Candidatus Thiodiazotropha taylori]
GAAKGAVTIFLQGLRNRLTKSGVNVLTVKPGFVDTPMTADFPKGALWASSEKVAQDINKAIDAQKSVAYVPWFWRYIMLIIKSIPEMVFKKLSL